jgi:hypothetical protein
VSTTGLEVGTGDALRPAWRRARFWVGFAVLIVLAAIGLSFLARSPAQPLDPASPSKSGAKALATVLRGYGIRVARSTSLDAAAADTAVLVPFPSAFSRADLDSLARRSGLLILVQPGGDAAPDGVTGDVPAGGPTPPNCDWPGAVAAGTVNFPDSATSYGYTGQQSTSCYGGAYLRVGSTVLLGSAAMLSNAHIADDGVAALAVNALTDDRQITSLVWLMPGGQVPAAGTQASVWDLFPTGVARAVAWLFLVSVLLIAWRGRRFGPVVREPLPVVVRAAEVVEGHGRLYRRARAHDRAAQALRAGTVHRLGSRLGLPRRSAGGTVIRSVAEATGRSDVAVAAALTGPPPATDHDLVALAGTLNDLERAAGVPPHTTQP